MGLKINPETGTIQNQEGGGITLDPGTNELVTIANGVMFPDGTAAEPGIRFSDDTNTGIYSPVNDTVALAGHGADIARFKGVTSAVNYLEVTPNITGGAVSLSVEGDDPNINLSLTGKGSGDVLLNNIAFPLSDGTNGQVLKTDGTNTLFFSTLDYNDLANQPTLVTDLSGLSDANVTAPGTNQVLKYNGSAFVNANVDYAEITNTPSVPTELSTLTDIDTTSMQQGWSLKYLNDKWVPRQDWTIDATIGRPVIADLVYGVVACIGNTARATIQNVTVTFDITEKGTIEFAQTAANAEDMAKAINRDLDAAGEFRVVAYHNAGVLYLVHSEGNDIPLANITGGEDGSGNLVFTNGGQSCTGYPVSGILRSTKGTLKASIGGIYKDLTAGTNGQVLKANSVTETGLEWSAFSYNDLADVPATFTPTAHTHVKADITDFVEADYATAAQGTLASTALQSVVSDTTPQLGGNLDVQTNKIVSTGTNDIVLDFADQTGTGGLSIQSGAVEVARYTIDAVRGQLLDVGRAGGTIITGVLDPSQNLDVANKAYVDSNKGIASLVEDTTPQLATQLDAQDNNIINIVGLLGNNGLSGVAFITNDFYLMHPNGSDIILTDNTLTPSTNVKIRNVADPIAAQDVATKAYVDGTKATLQTTDATPGTLVTLPVALDEEKIITIKVHGHEDATDDHIWKTMTFGVKNVGGTASLVGGIDSATGYDAGATTWQIVAGVSTGNATVTVTGESAHTINWRATITVD